MWLLYVFTLHWSHISIKACRLLAFAFIHYTHTLAMNIDTYILLLLIILFPTSHAFCNHPQIHNLHTHKRPQTAFCFYARHSSDMESRILSLETRLCGEIFSHVPMESTIVDIVNQLQQNSQEVCYNVKVELSFVWIWEYNAKPVMNDIFMGLETYGLLKSPTSDLTISLIQWYFHREISGNRLKA